jgi:DNA-directed RNA polymerase sigma subunit (sigma70/sigma32)
MWRLRARAGSRAALDSIRAQGSRASERRVEQAFDQVLDHIEIREVPDVADRLGDAERAVIRAHYELAQPAQTLNQIGDTLGLTGERTRAPEDARRTR